MSGLKGSDNPGPDEPIDPDGPPEEPSDEADVARLAEENARLRAELEEAEAAAAEAKRRSRGRLRRVATWVLVVLTSLTVVAATIGVWTQRTVADTDRYVALVAPLADDPAVTNPLADRLTQEIFLALDVEGRIQEAIASIPNLPSAATFLAGPVTAGAQNLVREQVREFLASDTFADLWEGLNRTAHEKIRALLSGDYEELPNVEINGGEVRLNLVPVVAEVIRRIAQEGVDALGIDVTVPEIPTDLDAAPAIGLLSSALGVSLPEDFGQVTILTVDELNEYQDAVRAVKNLVAAIFVLSLVLIAATLLVATDRRRAVVWLGGGVAIALFLAGVFLRRVRDNVIDSISGPGAKAAAEDVFAQVAASLRRAGMLVLAIALIAALVAYLAGRPPWVERGRARLRSLAAEGAGGSGLDVWVAGHADAVRAIGIAAGVLILFVTGIDWLPVAIVAVLVGLLLWWVAGAEQRIGATSDEPTPAEAPAG
jgi:hypothetical protein